MQRVVNAFYKTLKWLEEKASADDVAKTVPPEYHLGDVALYKKAFEASKAMYSKDGIVSAVGQKNAYSMPGDFDEELKTATVDLAKTFDDRFREEGGRRKLRSPPAPRTRCPKPACPASRGQLARGSAQSNSGTGSACGSGSLLSQRRTETGVSPSIAP